MSCTIKDYIDPEHYSLYLSYYCWSPNSFDEDKYINLMFAHTKNGSNGIGYTKHDEIKNKHDIYKMMVTGNNFDNKDFTDYPNIEYLILRDAGDKNFKNIHCLENLKIFHLHEWRCKCKNFNKEIQNINKIINSLSRLDILIMTIYHIDEILSLKLKLKMKKIIFIFNSDKIDEILPIHIFHLNNLTLSNCDDVYIFNTDELGLNIHMFKYIF